MQLHSKSFGSGQPLIILHGLFGMLDNWQTFAKRLATDYLVITVDLRNHGLSPHSDDMDYPLMADDLKSFMESNWLFGGATVMGHSMGGKVAMQLALNHPDLIKKLIVVDIAPVNYSSPHHHDTFRALDQVSWAAVKRRSDVASQLRKSIEEDEIVAFLLKNVARQRDGTYRWKMNLPSIRANYNSLLAAPEGAEKSPSEVPALFIKAERSEYILPEHLKAIHRLFCQTQVNEVPQASHWVHIDEPDLMYQMVTQWLLQPQD